MQKVKIYTAVWCPDCRRAKAFLRDKDIAFEDIDVEENPDTVEIIVRARGKRVLPTLEFEGRFMDGNHFNRSRFEADLREIGVLD